MRNAPAPVRIGIGTLVTLATGLLVSGPIHATGNGISLDVGTTGVGLHLSAPVLDSVNVRVGFNYYKNYGFKTDTDRINYDLDLNIKNFDVLADWFPTRSEFRVTGGLVYNRNTIDGVGLPKQSGAFSVQGQTFSVAQLGRIDGQIDFRSVAPYLGVGWGNAASDMRGWGFTGDVGVMFQGRPRVTLGTSGCSLPSPGCELLSVALVPVIRTETDRLNDDFKHYRYFPVIRVGITYRF